MNTAQLTPRALDVIADSGETGEIPSRTPSACSVGSGEVLHPATADLVRRFSEALSAKLLAAQKKYSYSDGWLQSDWMDECRAKLLEHVAKGDPRDVAAYCAFLWHHGEKTFVPTKADPYEALMNEVMACGGEVTPREIIFNHATFDMFMQRHVGKTALGHFADEVEAALCQACNGSGEQQFLTHGHGPDDYEVTGLCSKCGGTGAAIAAATEGAES